MEKITIMPEFGIQKINEYAEAYRNIANIFLSIEKDLERKQIHNKQELLYRRQLLDNQMFMAEQYLNMANILDKVIEDSYQYITKDKNGAKQLYRYLRRDGIEMKYLYFMDNESRNGVLGITMRNCSNKERILVSEVAEWIGVYYDMRLRASVKTPYFVEKEFKNYIFIQEPGFTFLSGQASATKEGEEISGDNILISDCVDGRVFFMLADGVGSGVEACVNSEKILEFMEKFLKAGYAKETAIQVLNGLLFQEKEEASMSSLDICELDLYKGICEFQKLGGVCSFHKRGYLVEKIMINHLPLGAFRTVSLDVVRRKMEEGDYIIMVSDGIVEPLSVLGCEEKLLEYISGLTNKNPQDMARKILEYCIGLNAGCIPDDMSVLVFGMWQN